MSDDPQAGLSMLARQQRQILAEMGSMRDDLAVLTAIAMREDGILAALLTEVRATHAQYSHLANGTSELKSHP